MLNYEIIQSIYDSLCYRPSGTNPRDDRYFIEKHITNVGQFICIYMNVVSENFFNIASVEMKEPVNGNIPEIKVYYMPTQLSASNTVIITEIDINQENKNLRALLLSLYAKL